MNKAEAAWQAKLRNFGCIVCKLDLKVDSPAEIHHMLSGGRRLSEMFVLPLCQQHHRSGRNDEVVSRDQSQRRFEARYGTELYLLEEVKKLCAALQK